MQRLREQSSSPDPATARAAELLGAMPPLDAGALRAPATLPLEATGRLGIGRLRLALVFAMSLGSVAAAAATLQGTGVLRRPWRSAPPATALPTTAPAAAKKSHGATGEEPAMDPTPSDSDTASIAPSVEVTANGHARQGATPHHAHSTPGGQPHATSKEVVHTGPGAGGEDESALLVGAVRALRRDGDAARASALAEESLQRYPQGVQVEEAMALAMEAASAGGDQTAATRDAKRYLSSFPSGRFADRAARILASPPR